MKFEVFAEDLAFPEGPIVMPDESVIFVEIKSGRLMRAWDGKKEEICNVGGGPNGAQIGPDGAVYICNNGGHDFERGRSLTGPENVGRIERVDIERRKVERLYEECDGRKLNSPNDLIFDDRGGIWFTDTGKHLPDWSSSSGLYYCRPSGGGVVQAHYPALSYNGVGLSPDQKSLYVVDTLSARLWKYSIEGEGVVALDPISSGRLPETLFATAPGNVWLDSLAVTASGKVCIGTLWNGGITIVSPDQTIERVDIDDKMVTNIAFGGEDMRSAYITCAEKGLILRTTWPEPGLALNFG